MTYQELGSLIGVPAYYLGSSLDVLRDNLLPKHNLPRIDALVVNKETKEAGASFYAGGRDGISNADYRDQLAFERRKVYKYEKWDEVVARLHAVYGGEEYLRSKSSPDH